MGIVTNAGTVEVLPLAKKLVLLLFLLLCLILLLILLIALLLHVLSLRATYVLLCAMCTYSLVLRVPLLRCHTSMQVYMNTALCYMYVLLCVTYM